MNKPKGTYRKFKKLEDDGIIKRQVFAEVPLRVEYSLTEFGEKIRPLMDSLANFGNEYKQFVRESKD